MRSPPRSSLTPLLPLLALALAACEDGWLPDEPPDDPPAATCATLCDACDPSGDCAAVCTALHAALEPRQAAAWMTCFAADACDPSRARQCIDGLACHDEPLIAAHCDVLARCAQDGRGRLDEAECRAHPYHEPSRWGCLRPDRRAQVGRCLAGERCDTLGPCLDNAVCAGDGMCGSLLATSLTVDCHRVCSNQRYACVFPTGTYGECWTACDRAARTLDDAQRRAFEGCAVDEAACPAGGLLWSCIRGLDCDAGPLRAVAEDFVARCGGGARGWPVDDWACLGHVIQSAMASCFDDSACQDIDACLARVTRCEGDAGCLDFLAVRRD